MANWYNQDGLLVKLGYTEAVTLDPTRQPGGEYKTYGELREDEITLDLTKLNTSTPLILNDVINLPKNARIDQVVLNVQTAATSGGAATLNIGTMKNDRTTVGAANAFVSAGALATINTQGMKTTLTVGSTGAGVSIGQTLTGGPYLITAQAGTAVYTAGVLRVRIVWYAV